MSHLWKFLSPFKKEIPESLETYLFLYIYILQIK